MAVIRRPPLGELLPKAHDMAREWALISALGPTPVPVPAALGFCDDVGVTGQRFYVMGHIDGHPLYNAADTERWAPAPVRQKLAHSFIDVLADLHAVEPDAVGAGRSWQARQLCRAPALHLVQVVARVGRPGRIRRPARPFAAALPAAALAAAGAGADCPRRLRSRTTASSALTAPWRRWWTGRSRRWAIRWRISPTR
ncbi:MAG: phosphotransferase [Caulobacteraceae bacterium]